MKKTIAILVLVCGLASAQTVTCNCDPTQQSCIIYITGGYGPEQALDGAYAIGAGYLLEQFLQWLAAIL